MRRFVVAVRCSLVALALGEGVARCDIVLVDVTVGSGLESFVHTPNFLATPGLNEWILSGVAVADFNRDGFADIVVQKGGVGQDQFYLNLGNGTFASVASHWGLAAVHAGNGVSCADFDRDGDIDIHMSSYGLGNDNLGQAGKNRLYRNDGAIFTDVAASVGVAFTAPNSAVADGAAWGDFDLDGDLDLAVAGWSSTGGGNRLYRNDSGMFTDVTGVAATFGFTWGFQPLFVDLTGDDFPELLVAADFETSRAFRNMRNGSFELATTTFGMGLDRNGMGICVADFDRNGWIDCYVTSIHQSDPPLGDLNGNALYLNQGGGVCVESAASFGCDDGGWGWGTIAVDLDHDGWEDIVEVNGRNASEWANEQEYIYRNLGEDLRGAKSAWRGFARQGADTGFTIAGDARCVVSLDFDRDGDLDLLCLMNAGGLRLFRNDSNSAEGSTAAWLQVVLQADARSRCAPHGIGAVVECEVGGEVWRRWMHSGSGFHSSNEPLVHFGFPTTSAVGAVAERVTVRWPSGQATTLLQVPLRARLEIQAPRAADIDGNGEVGASDLALLLAQWGDIDSASRDERRVDINGDRTVDAADLSLVLQAWGTGTEDG
ncbi:MAG: FG-GAP-like repeat-containing protein [Limnohabitans sp.]|nr:FG-GAP-like repeat-containing protein [Limnohabitans sp.]